MRSFSLLLIAGTLMMLERFFAVQSLYDSALALISLPFFMLISFPPSVAITCASPTCRGPRWPGRRRAVSCLLTIYFPADHGRADHARAHAECRVTGDVAALERGRRVVVPERQVRLVAGLDPAEALAGEVAFQEAVAVLEHPQEGVHPHRAARVVVLEEREVRLLEHVRADAVGAEHGVPVLAYLVVVAYDSCSCSSGRCGPGTSRAR